MPIRDTGQIYTAPVVGWVVGWAADLEVATGWVAVQGLGWVAEEKEVAVGSGWEEEADWD